jgi:hypothetical protein
VLDKASYIPPDFLLGGSRHLTDMHELQLRISEKQLVYGELCKEMQREERRCDEREMM